MTAPTGFRLRAARPADADALLRVRTAVHENHLSLTELAERGISPLTLSAQLAVTPPSGWVAEDDGGQAIGFAMADLEDASLFALFVLPPHEGRGVGTALLALAEAALFAQHPRAWLETAASSRAAAFYRAHGWGDALAVGDGDVRLHKTRPVAPEPKALG